MESLIPRHPVGAGRIGKKGLPGCRVTARHHVGCSNSCPARLANLPVAFSKRSAPLRKTTFTTFISCPPPTSAMITRMNADCGAWVCGLLEVGPNDRVLEVGFGPGVVIQRLAKLAEHVVGV